MALDPELLRQLIETFKVELDEQIQVIVDGLLQLEKGEEKEKTKIIESLFRSAHNIKGTARGLGISNIGEIAHRLESLFSVVQSGQLILTSEVADLCLEALDKMRSCLTAYIDNKSIDFNLQELLGRLDKANNITGGDIVNKTVSKPKPTTAPTITEPEPVTTKKVTKSESATTNSKDKQHVDTISHDNVRVAIEKIDKVSALMEEIQVNKISIEDQFIELTGLNNNTKQFNQIWKQILTILKNTPHSDADESLQKLCHTGNDYLLEMNQASNSLHKNMRLQLNELTTLSNSLQEEIRTLRLIPAENLLCTLPRYVRDLSHQLNKKAELIIKNTGVRVDKFVLEGLKDPIIHILRNAIDHGIESSEEREKKGKTAEGHIILDIKEEGNQILINIQDDGAGINAKKVAEIAERKNLVTKDEIALMSENEILDLIFRPGFSTKDIITDVSGRGVGLNVVKANINDLKGQVTVTATANKGTLFSLRVPITLSSERGLLVRSGEQLFIIPSSSVERSIIVNKSEIVDIVGGQAIVVDQHTITLRTLADVLGINSDIIKGAKLSIVIIKHGTQSIALLVNEVIGEREIVVKRLNAPLNNVKCISGGTLLERNQVVPVLNSGDVLNLALHTNMTARVKLLDDTVKESTRTRILVVDDSITTRTLEKNILESKNYDVTVAVNGQEAWDILQKQQFSLLITDVSMPIMDGFTLTENVKKSDRFRQLPVIIVTSLGSDAEKSRGVEVGANAYIVKSEFESGTLLEIVEQLV